MEPITETIQIAIEFSNTTAISLSTHTISDTYVTEGTVYIPYLWSSFDPIRILSSLMIFLAIGVMMKKPTAFLIAWASLTIFGVFSQPGIYWYWTGILLCTLFMLYHLFNSAKGHIV
jgi:hypothetical protein